MKFSEFSKQWLHENYYKNSAPIGKKGDFYTAVSVGELFGCLLAKHFLNLLEKQILKLPCEIVEIGANEGYLIKDFGEALPKNIFKDLQFFIIEPHEKLQILQKQNISHINFTHKHSLSSCEFNNAFIFSNELFDSFACELIKNKQMAFIENYEIYFDQANDEVKEECQKLNLQTGELATGLSSFFKELDKACKKFIFASFDYGLLEPFYLSLRIYKEHLVYNPFEVNLKDFFGQSDLTYNVNFSHLLNLIKSHNFKLLSFQKQKLALMEFGFEAFMREQNASDYKKYLNQAKYLFLNFDEKFHFLEFQKL